MPSSIDLPATPAPPPSLTPLSLSPERLLPPPPTSMRPDSVSADAEAGVPTLCDMVNTALPSDSESDMETDGFQVVHSRKRQRRGTPPLPPTTNHAQPNQPPKGVKIPPIIVSGVKKWTPIFSRLRAAGVTFTAKFVGERLHLLTTNIDSFRLAQRDLETHQVEFYTYTLKEDQELKTVLRGLPNFTPPQDIKEALEDLGFTPTHVAALERRASDASHPTNSFFVRFRKVGSWPQIWKIDNLLGIRVSFDHFTPKNNIPQCFRCQQYGHGSGNCHRPTKCVRCGGPHPRGECPLPDGATPKCANCEGPHPASWRGCEAHLRAKQALSRYETPRGPQEARRPAPRCQQPPPAPQRQHPAPESAAPAPMRQPSSSADHTTSEAAPSYAEAARGPARNRRRHRQNRNPANRTVSREADHVFQGRPDGNQPAPSATPTAAEQPRRCGLAGAPPRPSARSHPQPGAPAKTSPTASPPTHNPAPSTKTSAPVFRFGAPTPTPTPATPQTSQQDHISVAALTRWITTIVPIILGGDKSPRELLAAIMVSVQELLSYG